MFYSLGLDLPHYRTLLIIIVQRTRISIIYRRKTAAWSMLNSAKHMAVGEAHTGYHPYTDI